MVEMTVTKAEISAMFDALLDGTRSREEIARWAQERRRADDQRMLVYEPTAAESQIWEGILYLIGVDTEVAPGSYLFSTEAFREFRELHTL